MRCALLVVVAACGAPPAPAPIVPPTVRHLVPVEWTASQGEGDLVIVTLVVDGKPVELGTLPAATELERGTPRTCALRVVHAERSELTCGDMTAYYAAELRDGELVIVHGEGSASREVDRIPIAGDGIVIKPYRLPE